MLTYRLLKNKRMALSATSRKSQSDAGLQSVQAQNIILSATGSKYEPDADLHPDLNPEHALISNKQGRPARC